MIYIHSIINQLCNQYQKIATLMFSQSRRDSEMPIILLCRRFFFVLVSIRCVSSYPIPRTPISSPGTMSLWLVVIQNNSFVTSQIDSWATRPVLSVTSNTKR